MRILITTGIFPPDIGGPATYVPQIATALADRGHKTTVVTLSDSLLHPDGRYPFKVVRLPRRMFKPWRWFRTIFTLTLLGRRAHVLFVNGLAMEAVMANVVLRKPMVQKVVGDLAWERATSWGWVQDDFEEFQKNCTSLKVRTLKFLRTWCTRSADKVIVPSRYLASWVGNWGVPEENISVIHNAVEPFNGITPAEVPLKTHMKVVTVGRLVPWKHVDKVMEAIVRFDALGLIIIGDGQERGRLEALACALGIAERVYFAGKKSRAETLRLMAASDLFVLNSTYEGFSHVILEAMGLGLPIVATAVGGTPELVHDGVNGRLVLPRKDRALSEAIFKIMFCPSERKRFANGARQTVERFGLSNMIEATERVFLVFLESIKGK